MLDKITQTGSLSLGIVGVNKLTTPGTTVAGVTIGGGTTDSGFADFFKITYSQFNAGALSAASGSSSIGSCTVNFYNASAATPPPAEFTFSYLNAGPDVNIHGPDGVLAMPLQTVDGFSIYGTPSTATSFIPATGGSFTFDNGTGGPDVGPFTAALSVAAPVTWTNLSNLSTITRANGAAVNWSGGDPGTYVSITGTSFGSLNGSTESFVAGAFVCTAPTSAGTFTIPSAVLLSLPPSYTISGGGITISTSTLSLSNVSAPVSFTATGLDYGYAAASVENTINVTYQ